jgi:two-component system chemotaxis response regulator CheB
MAGEAIKLDAATLILPLQKIAAVLTDLVNDRGEIKFGS